jgi:hypothetical protein
MKSPRKSMRPNGSDLGQLGLACEVLTPMSARGRLMVGIAVAILEMLLLWANVGGVCGEGNFPVARNAVVVALLPLFKHVDARQTVLNEPNSERP